MFRKRPLQLPLIDDLNNTYQDICDQTIKNLTLEENNQLLSALKGWKSLHTSLLYKIDLFEKLNSKFSLEESNILQQLKSIRDQNVKHLIRVQLRLDELNRINNSLPPPIPPKRKSPSTSPSSTINYNLRSTVREKSTGSNSNNSNLYSNSNVSTNAIPRPMLKSLRTNSSSSSALSKSKSTNLSANQAANVSWLKPTPKISKPISKSSQDDSFHDFDQDTIEFSNWDKIDSSKPSYNDNFNFNQNYSTNTTNNNKNVLDVPLINLDDDSDYQDNNNDDYDYISSDYYSNIGKTTNYDLVQSFEDLTIKPVASNSPKAKLEKASRSTSDLPKKKPYVYKKPQPMNINYMMQKQRSANSKQPLPNTSVTNSKKIVSTKPKPPSTSKQTVKPKLQQSQSQDSTLKPRSNIQYNYVKPNTKPNVPKIKPVPKVKKQEIHSPTMDDLLDGYDDTVEDYVDNPADPHGYLTKEEEQNKLIKSIRGIDPVAAKLILNDIVVHGDEVYWDDIVGLESAKSSLKEAVVYPFLRPDLFKGLREPTRGMLLFGPPGTGKTMLARAVATESKSTFFSINPSSLTSKYLGESEKLVKALFLLAKKLSPSIVFIDEIDSLLSARAEGENDSTRRIKNEFLVQWSELSSAAAGRESGNDEIEDVSRVLILGATNLPWSIDEAARRRFVRRQYIPLPEDETRISQIKKLLKYQNNTLTESDYQQLIQLTEGFSGSDITALAKDSAMGPLRSLGDKLLLTPTEQIRAINIDDFKSSLQYIRPSVSKEGLKQYEDWAIQFGSSGA